MKWAVKQTHISNLIDYAKKNLNSENYIFLGTNEILSEQQDNFKIFCKKIPKNITIECLIEKTERDFKSGITIFSLKKEYVLENEVSLFGISIEKKLDPIILLINSIDYRYSQNNSNKQELLWFIEKILGTKTAPQDHFAVKVNVPNINSLSIRGITSATSIIKYDPDIRVGRRPSSDFFRREGMDNYKDSDFAKFCFLVSIQLEPDNFMSHYQLGLIYFQEKLFTNALDCFKKSQQANPNFSYNKKMKAECYFALGMSSLAIAEYDQIDIEKQPDAEKLDMKLHLAVYKTFTQDYDEAISVYNEINYERKNASDTWPDFLPSFFKNWITLLQKTNRVQDEIMILKLALKELEFTTYEIAYGMFAHDLALRYLKLEQVENSINTCKNALDKDPKIWPILLIYAICFLKKNEPENALYNFKNAEILIKNEPESVAKNFWLTSITEFIKMLNLDIEELNLREQIEKIPNLIETEWERSMRVLGAVSFTSNKEQNNEIVLKKLCQCEGYLFWVDAYFDSPGLKWLSQAYAEKNSSIKKIEILAKFSQHDPKKDIFEKKFKELFDQLKSKLNRKNISLEFRICFETKFAKKMHARYWYFYKIPPPYLQSAWSIPSIMNIKRGQNDSINPTEFSKDNFDEIWDNSLNFETDYDKIISMYEEWRIKQTSE